MIPRFTCLAAIVLGGLAAGPAASADERLLDLAAAGAESLADQWRLLLPGGHEQPVTLTPAGERRYRLDAGGSRFSGVYEVRDSWLVVVEPEEARREEYEWKIRSPYLLMLAAHSQDIEHDYRGAVLFRPRDSKAEIPPEAAKPEVAARGRMAEPWTDLESKPWRIEHRPIEGLADHSAWHIEGTMWQVRLYPEWIKLDELDKKFVYEIDAIPLDQNYGVIDFYVYRRPKQVAGRSDGVEESYSPSPAAEAPNRRLGDPASRPGAAPDLSGEWLMTLPAGFEHRATLIRKDGNRYRLDHPEIAGVLEGLYEVRNGKLAVIEPDDERMTELEWKILNRNVLQLVGQRQPSPTGANYVDATLTRQEKSLDKAKD